MGGYGSGRLTSTHRKVEECIQLPIRELASEGAVRFGQRQAGECYAAETRVTHSLLVAFVFDAQPPAPSYSFSYRPPAGGNLMTVRGALLWSVAGTGSRAWYACPECRVRRGILYLLPGEQRLACRVCCRLRYASEPMTVRARLERRARRYYELAGCSSHGLGFTRRPRGMRRTTFNSYMDKATVLERRAQNMVPVPRCLTQLSRPEGVGQFQRNVENGVG